MPPALSITFRSIRLACAGLAVLALSAPPAHATEPAQHNAQRLAQVPVFALGYVGFVAHISDGERLYRQLLAAPDATRTLRALLADAQATPEAKLYAMCGLQALAPGEFEAARAPLQRAAPQVSVLRADILQKEDTADWLARIAADGCGPGA